MLKIHNSSHPLGDVFMYSLYIYIYIQVYSYVMTSPKVQGDKKQTKSRQDKNQKPNTKIKERKQKTKC